MSKSNPDFRIGFGVDIHQLVEDRPLIIGGVEIDAPFGALGHSDADVLLHAICDAMLGALALGDIGSHFPDTDPQYEGIDSKILLEKTNELISKEGFKVGNIDSTVLLETPKLRPCIDQMRSVVSDSLSIDVSQVSIKATRGEGLGFVGESKGIKAYCTVLLIRD